MTRTPAQSSDRYWMQRAIDLARRCPPAAHAYSVGAVIVSADGTELAYGYSREDGHRIHAEESALDKLPPSAPQLATATLYSSLEPCSRRSSPRAPCAQRILAARIPRTVVAWREPALFIAECIGVELLTAGGVTVLEMPEMAEAAKAPNRHLGQLP